MGTLGKPATSETRATARAGLGLPAASGPWTHASVNNPPPDEPIQDLPKILGRPQLRRASRRQREKHSPRIGAASAGRSERRRNVVAGLLADC